MGRVFCKIEEYREKDAAPEAAVRGTTEWLDNGLTGSHRKSSSKRMVEGAVAYLYGHAKLPTWDAYYYAVYTCGLNNRLDPAASDRASRAWNKAVTDCRSRFPSSGEGYGNDALRNCLSDAMNGTVAAQAGQMTAHQKK